MTQVILPMAGKGLRFQKEFPDDYKPFIKAQDKHLFEYALESLNGIDSIEPIFVLRHDNSKKYVDLINQSFDNAKTLVLKSETRGALETVNMAKDLINPNEKLLILDSDLSFRSSAFIDFVNSASKNDNGFPTFESSLPRFSYCEEHSGEVLRTVEKEVISEKAIVGAYFFGAASNLLDIITEVLSSGVPTVGEYYIAPIYNKLIQKGMKTYCFDTTTYHSLGTPSELEEFLG